MLSRWGGLLLESMPYCAHLKCSACQQDAMQPALGLLGQEWVSEARGISGNYENSTRLQERVAESLQDAMRPALSPQRQGQALS